MNESNNFDFRALEFAQLRACAAKRLADGTSNIDNVGERRAHADRGEWQDRKIIGRKRRIGRPALRSEPYDPNAEDGDGDGEVQDRTIWARPAGRIRRAIARAAGRGASWLEGSRQPSARQRVGRGGDASVPNVPNVPKRPLRRRRVAARAGRLADRLDPEKKPRRVETTPEQRDVSTPKPKRPILKREIDPDRDWAINRAGTRAARDGEPQAVFREEAAAGYAIVGGEERIRQARERFGDPIHEVNADGSVVRRTEPVDVVERPTQDAGPDDAAPDPNDMVTAWRNRRTFPGGGKPESAGPDDVSEELPGRSLGKHKAEDRRRAFAHARRLTDKTGTRHAVVDAADGNGFEVVDAERAEAIAKGSNNRTVAWVRPKKKNDDKTPVETVAPKVTPDDVPEASTRDDADKPDVAPDVPVDDELAKRRKRRSERPDVDAPTPPAAVDLPARKRSTRKRRGRNAPDAVEQPSLFSDEDPPASSEAGTIVEPVDVVEDVKPSKRKPTKPRKPSTADPVDAPGANETASPASVTTDEIGERARISAINKARKTPTYKKKRSDREKSPQSQKMLKHFIESQTLGGARKRAADRSLGQMRDDVRVQANEVNFATSERRRLEAQKRLATALARLDSYEEALAAYESEKARTATPEAPSDATPDVDRAPEVSVPEEEPRKPARPSRPKRQTSDTEATTTVDEPIDAPDVPSAEPAAKPKRSSARKPAAEATKPVDKPSAKPGAEPPIVQKMRNHENYKKTYEKLRRQYQPGADAPKYDLQMLSVEELEKRRATAIRMAGDEKAPLSVRASALGEVAYLNDVGLPFVRERDTNAASVSPAPAARSTRRAVTSSTLDVPADAKPDDITEFHLGRTDDSASSGTQREIIKDLRNDDPYKEYQSRISVSARQGDDGKYELTVRAGEQSDGVIVPDAAAHRNDLISKRDRNLRRFEQKDDEEALVRAAEAQAELDAIYIALRDMNNDGPKGPDKPKRRSAARSAEPQADAPEDAPPKPTTPARPRSTRKRTGVQSTDAATESPDAPSAGSPTRARKRTGEGAKRADRPVAKRATVTLTEKPTRERWNSQTARYETVTETLETPETYEIPIAPVKDDWREVEDPERFIDLGVVPDYWWEDHIDRMSGRGEGEFLDEKYGLVEERKKKTGPAIRRIHIDDLINFYEDTKYYHDEIMNEAFEGPDYKNVRAGIARVKAAMEKRFGGFMVPALYAYRKQLLERGIDLKRGGSPDKVK